MSAQPAIFIDKDGTLVRDVPYNVAPELIELVPSASIGLPQLVDAGYRLVVISNQSGVARGMFRREAMTRVEQHIGVLLAEIGVQLDGFYYCPHHPLGIVAEFTGACDCRKPKPGLILQAAAELDVDLSRSWMLGDILDDVEAGHRAGCRSLLIQNGGETEWQLSPLRVPDAVVGDLAAAADYILGQCRRVEGPRISQVSSS